MAPCVQTPVLPKKKKITFERIGVSTDFSVGSISVIDLPCTDSDSFNLGLGQSSSGLILIEAK
jgi:hypothetical protein